MAGLEGLLQYTLNVGHNQELRVIADPDNRLGNHIGNGIWTSAHEQALFIGNRKQLTRNRSVLELGSGLGLVGQAAVLGGATVVLSDMTEMMPLLELNVKANEPALTQSPGTLRAPCVLRWGSELSNHPYGPSSFCPDLIVGSDITYDEDQFVPLLQTIAAYVAAHLCMKVILSAPDRQETSSFLHTAAAHGLIWRLLSRIQKPELLTPVSIYQLLLGPKPSPEVLKLAQKSPSKLPNTTPEALQLAQVAPSQLPNMSVPAAPGAESTAVNAAGHLSSGNVSPKPLTPTALSSTCHNTQPQSAAAGLDPSKGAAMMVKQAASGPQTSSVNAGDAKSADQRAVHTLLVLDFDWSMIEVNSDTFVVRELGGWDTFARLKQQGLPWTQLMDQALLALQLENGCTAADITASCARIPMDATMKQVLQEAYASGAVHLAIVSDANTVFIDAVLEAQDLQGCFHQVFTNPAQYNEGALRVSPYHAEPHGCTACPPNLCKGLVLEELLLEHNYQQVIYLGDGRGDYYPCTRLGPSDHILARHSYPDGSACALLKLLKEQGAQPQDCLQFLAAQSEAVTASLSLSGTAGSSSPLIADPSNAAAEQSGAQRLHNQQQQQKQQPDANEVDAARCQDDIGSDGTDGDVSLPPPPPRPWEPPRVRYPTPLGMSQQPQTVLAGVGSSIAAAAAMTNEGDAASSLLSVHAAAYNWDCPANAAAVLRFLLNQKFAGNGH